MFCAERFHGAGYSGFELCAQRMPPCVLPGPAGGAQRWVDETYPGAHFASQGVQYTCVVARTVKGWREFDEQVGHGYNTMVMLHRMDLERHVEQHGTRHLT